MSDFASGISELLADNDTPETAYLQSLFWEELNIAFKMMRNDSGRTP